MTTVSGTEAKNYAAVRLDNFENANRGELISANDQTGEVAYKAVDGTTTTVTLGAHAICIIRKHR